MNAVITTSPFNKENNFLKKLISNGVSVSFNEKGRKLTKEEIKEFLKNKDPDIIIAGTENYNSEIFDICPNLKIISRVGIGLDSVDLEGCEKRNIKVSNTPDAPSNAVAELIIGQMICCLRGINYTKNWNRYIGREISSCKIGIIGYGRIGKKVMKKLDGFSPKEIMVNDINLSIQFKNFVEKSRIFNECDVISFHVPLTSKTKNLLNKNTLNLLKKDAIIINMSRGGIINEDDLYDWLKDNPSASAVIDTFEEEPYNGSLLGLKNAYLTPHLGSCTKKSRKEMEDGSVINVLKHFNWK